MPCQNCSALPSHHDLDPEFKVFYGMASPPTSYGGYGGNANEKPKYTFEYPKSWKSEQPSKVLLPTVLNAKRPHVFQYLSEMNDLYGCANNDVITLYVLCVTVYGTYSFMVVAHVFSQRRELRASMGV